MISAVCLTALLQTQRLSAPRMTDAWYDSVKGIVAWGETVPQSGVQSEFRFGTLIKGQASWKRVLHPPWVVLDEQRFVTHHDYSALVDAVSGEVTFLGRVPVESAAGGYIYTGSFLFVRGENAILRRLPTASLASMEFAVRVIVTEGDTIHLDLIEASVDGKTVAWSHMTSAGPRRLNWQRSGIRRAVDIDHYSAAVSSSGSLIYVFSRTDKDFVVAFESSTANEVFRRVFEKGDVIRISADEASDNVLVVRGEAWEALVIGTDGKTVSSLGHLRPSQ